MLPLETRTNIISLVLQDIQLPKTNHMNPNIQQFDLESVIFVSLNLIIFEDLYYRDETEF